MTGLDIIIIIAAILLIGLCCNYDFLVYVAAGMVLALTVVGFVIYCLIPFLYVAGIILVVTQ